MIALYVVATLLSAILISAAYMTVAVNIVANRQDRINTMQPIANDPDAFMRALAGATGQPCARGNAVEVYQNGRDIFPPMLSAIAASRSTVHFSSYVFWSGEIATQFAEAFCAAAQRGVRVRLIVDHEGSHARLDAALVAHMRRAGCRFVWYRRAQWFDVVHYNQRTHRRLLVIDGLVAFTGGAGVADQWLGDGDRPTQWRDTHVRVTGPAVQALQAGFTDNWNQCTDELLLAKHEYPPLEVAGQVAVMPVISTPAGGASAAQRTMGACIASATRTLDVTNAYFVPTPAFVDLLCQAQRRGVRVSILVPGPYHNKPLVRRASRHTWRALLESGIEIHEHQATMVHAKTMVIDQLVILVGSINFDPRSFALNAEAAVVAVDRDVAEGMEAAFRGDLAQSRPVEDAELARLSAWMRAGDALLYWVRGQL